MASPIPPASLDLAAGFPAADDTAWRQLVDKVLKGADFEKRLVSRTADGLPIAPLFSLADLPAMAEAHVPGQPPFTRGFTASRPDGRWDIRTIVAETSPAAANRSILGDLEGGATSVALILGAGSLPAETAALDAALRDVDLALCRIVAVAGEETEAAAAALEQIWTARGIAPADRKAGLGGDPLGTLARTGQLSTSIDAALAAAGALARRYREMPGVTALIADGHPYHAAGASEAQELAAVCATLVAYLEACEAAGLPPSEALGKISIGLASDADQILTIAKLRAARRMIARVAEACGAGEAARGVEIASTTAWRMMAKRDPWVNMLRTTVACAAAAMGGADAIMVLPFTWPLGKPDAFARRIARNTQIVLQEESGLGRVMDPAGGSFAIERLTEDLARHGWSLFQAWQRDGGMAKALVSGLVQDQIAATAAARARDIAHGRLALTGSSAFPRLGSDGISVEPWPQPAPNRKTAAVTVRALAQKRLAEPYEALRDAADAAAARDGAPPKVYLANLGALTDYNARATWITNLLAAGGIEAMAGEGLTNSAAAAEAFSRSGATVACICSDDATYGLLGEATAMALKAAGARHVLLAGRPRDSVEALRQAGVDAFLYAGMDQVAALSDLHRVLGIAERA